MYILDISRTFFFVEMTFKINHKTAHTGGKLDVFWGFKLFFIIFLSMLLPLPRKIEPKYT